ncbi:hypothetical protein TEA_024748 [Camellia sinensis var. sinensis]|uniref:HD-Zip IV C-terminal domain-containing protein n=1 Tax=Camellia sinensis var. sinensis TaxID=542762 RepID=A0A4S4ELJ8_CAMSN|nr:hypothetical protein TEA_024748 [Camellia sinensis var. sinensis]
MLVVQETCIDPLGTIVAYAPIDLKCLDMAANGVDSSNIPILPSGIIISSDGHPILATRDGASTSSATTTVTGGVGGSILTVAFQILACEASSSKKLNMEFVSSINALINSTVQNIKSGHLLGRPGPPSPPPLVGALRVALKDLVDPDASTRLRTFELRRPSGPPRARSASSSPSANALSQITIFPLRPAIITQLLLPLHLATSGDTLLCLHLQYLDSILLI